MALITGTPQKGTTRRISKDRALNVGDVVKTIIETERVPLYDFSPTHWRDELLIELTEQGEIEVLYTKVDIIDVETTYPYPQQQFNTGRIYTEVHYKVTGQSPIAPLVILAAIIIIAVIVGVVVVAVLIVREVHWLVATAVDISKDIAGDLKEGVTDLTDTIFGKGSLFGSGLGNLAGAGALAIPLGLIIILIIGGLVIAYTVAKRS